MIVTQSTIAGKLNVTISPNTKADGSGVAAPIDGVINWEVLTGDCVLNPSADGGFCEVLPTTVNSVSTFRAFFDADLDADEAREIEVLFSYTVIPQEAQGAGVNVEVVEP